MSSLAQTTTAEQLLEMPGHEHFGLKGGKLVPESPPGFEHGGIVGEISAAFWDFVQVGKLGTVVVKAGFVISRDPDTVRGPDVAFVRAERVPAGGVRGFFQGAPDLAVEVISPSDRASDVIAKAQVWIRAGCTAVWVIDPETKTASVYSRGPQVLLLSADDALACEELLPDFRLPMAQALGG